jgi:hypothetical protein
MAAVTDAEAALFVDFVGQLLNLDLIRDSQLHKLCVTLGSRL